MIISTETDTEITRQKRELRLEMKARRGLLNEGQRARASWELCLRLASWLETRPERSVGVYLARPQEISLDLLIEELLLQGYEIAAPRVDVAGGEMAFWRLESLQATEIGPWNVRQPVARQRIENLPLILVPGLAFDGAGGRLGTGGGWYDGVLHPSQTAVGVGFDCQIVAQVPLEAHDKTVDFLASEARWLEIEKG